MAFLISVFSPGVKHGLARPRSQQEGPRATRSDPRVRRSGARGRSLLTHGGGRELGYGGHFLVPFIGLVDMAVALSAPLAGASASAASGFRIDGPSSANR